MNKRDAIAALNALAQETRLDVFRLLIRAGREGMCAGEIATALGVRQNTMSANLSVLAAAGLIRGQRQGRSIRYRADIAAMRSLIAYLLEDCCGGKAGECAPLLDTLICFPASHEDNRNPAS